MCTVCGGNVGVEYLSLHVCISTSMWRIGSVVECFTRDERPRVQASPASLCQCVVSLSKNINPSLVLVQPRKTCPFITERLLMGRKESNQTNKHPC